uniref:antA/AntB antirepressor family protein n=1 Tax=Anaerophilus nitritogenes TaxID=2498136 RepID=UPI0019310C40
MKALINIKNENGKQLVSAKELYIGLGLRKQNWARWYPTNIQKNEFFKENLDWVGVLHNEEGNETLDFAITLDFAKHIAMMARTEKSHLYRNYFIECEKQVKQQFPQFSKELQAIFVIDQRTTEIDNRITDLENNMPLFNIECKELQAIVRKKGV